MALFGDSKKPFTYEVMREGDENMLIVDMENYPLIPSIEDDPICMSRIIDILAESGQVTKIVFTQKRNYEYGYQQTLMLRDVAAIYKQLTKGKSTMNYMNLLADVACSRYVAPWYSFLQKISMDSIKKDPIGAYMDLKREMRDERINIDKSTDQNFIHCDRKYLAALQFISSLLERTKLIEAAQPYIAGAKVWERDIYRRIFAPEIRPDFMFTKLMANFPTDGEEIDSYSIDKNTEVTIFKLQDTVHYLYHLSPPEFKLDEAKYEILDSARKILSEHKPTKNEFVNPERMREVFFNIGMDLIDELASYSNLRLASKEIEELTKILVRYSVGFGLIEVLLQDDKVQDITINSPLGDIPMFIVHQDYTDCKTNIVPTRTDAESWASKLRLISGKI